MVQFLAGLKGEGKTRKMIDMANQDVKVTDGHIVYIDDDMRHSRDLHRDIRFVEVEKGLLANCREFIGFVLGILSQNNDITHIYIDGLNNIVCSICDKAADSKELVFLKERLDEISEKEHVEFIVSLHSNVEDLPEAIKGALV